MEKSITHKGGVLTVPYEWKESLQAFAVTMPFLVYCSKTLQQKNHDSTNRWPCLLLHKTEVIFEIVQDPRMKQNDYLCLPRIQRYLLQ